MITTFCDCGHVAESDGIATGYASIRDHRGDFTLTVCYSCADELQRCDVAKAQPGDKFYAYVSSDGGRITTWTDGTLMRRVRFGANHPFSRERHYLTAVDRHGRVWSGVGDCGMWATLRLTKQVA